MSSETDTLFLDRVRQGDGDAWGDLIAAYEGRLLAFAESRIGNRSASEDVVQETFLGLLNSLPNYDNERPLEAYLFSICAHKLTDHLRREGRRPTLPLATSSDASDASDWDLAAPGRPVSSMARSQERRNLEEQALSTTLQEEIARWRARGDWQKIQVMELLFVRGWTNKRVAETVGITEQQVANLKFDFLARLRNALRKAGLSADVFPELYSS